MNAPAPQPAAERSRRFGLRSLEPMVLAALGAVQTLACVHTWAWGLPLLTLAVLALRLDRVPPRRAAWLAWCYGCAWLAAGTWCCSSACTATAVCPHRWQRWPCWRWPGRCRCTWLARGGSTRAAGAGGCGGDALLFAGAVLLAEWARGVVFTGFPWVAAGYSQVDAPIATLAPWVGVYGVGAVLAFAAALVGALPRIDRRARPTLVAAVVAMLTLPGVPGQPEFSTATGEVRVSLLQPNVRQDEKFAEERLPATLAWVATALRTAPGALVVTPETAVPLLPDQLEQVAPGYWQGSAPSTSPSSAVPRWWACRWAASSRAIPTR